VYFCLTATQGSVLDDRPHRTLASVKSVSLFEVKEKGYAEVHKREQFTNELALAHEEGRTLVLGDKKREDEDAERRFADGRLEYRRNTG
jgi:hypothetical protein